MMEFMDTIVACFLNLIPGQGSRFTWTGIRHGRRIWKKLDRLLVNLEWQQCFPEDSLQHLNITGSDHSPLLLKVSHRTGTAPWLFKFQRMWAKHPTFRDTVRLSWEQPAQGYGMFAFSFKLKRLKQDLRRWNKDTFGDVFKNLAAAEERVRECEVQLEEEGTEDARAHWSHAQA
ncbi:uncharacterized protein [Coffea arabica]|uniref:Endonuclease/exonuclease/phosphatase domain-containing protein n=1 Tax=Coffea arabica TaxID=13443 RepID=A0ABM4U2D4_COFAR